MSGGGDGVRPNAGPTCGTRFGDVVPSGPQMTNHDKETARILLQQALERVLDELLWDLWVVGWGAEES